MGIISGNIVAGTLCQFRATNVVHTTSLKGPYLVARWSYGAETTCVVLSATRRVVWCIEPLDLHNCLKVDCQRGYQSEVAGWSCTMSKLMFRNYSTGGNSGWGVRKNRFQTDTIPIWGSKCQNTANFEKKIQFFAFFGSGAASFFTAYFFKQYVRMLDIDVANHFSS